MKLLQRLGIVLCLAVFCVLVVPTATADEWNRKTVITFSGPVEVPGVGQHNLPAGTYVFKILDSQSDRHIVQIFNQDETQGVAGHRDTFFRELKDIRLNDEIQIQTATGLFRYQVDWMRVVEPRDTTVLEPSSKESTVTLVTCYPFYFVGAAPKRFVVRAHQY